MSRFRFLLAVSAAACLMVPAVYAADSATAIESGVTAENAESSAPDTTTHVGTSSAATEEAGKAHDSNGGSSH
ncbi:MAG TPA: hypothetical protein VIF12_05540, partial [Micavibrio sp.]